MDEMELILKESFEKILSDSCDKDLLEKSERNGVPDSLLKALEEFGVFLIGIDEDEGGSGFEKKNGLDLAIIAGKYALPLPFTAMLLSNWVAYREKLDSKGTVSCGPLNQRIKIGSGNEVVNGTIENMYGYIKGNDILVLATNEQGEDYLVLLDTSQVDFKVKHNLAGEPVYSFTLINHSPTLVKSIESCVVRYYFGLQLLLNLAVATGALEKIFELTTEHANTRVQFGKQIGSFQMNKNNISIMAESVKQAQVMTLNCIAAIKDEKLDNQGYFELMVAQLKVCESITTATPIAHQIHAAMGYTQEHILHYYTRKLWSLREEYKSETYWSNEISRFVLEQEKSLWELVTQ